MIWAPLTILFVVASAANGQSDITYVEGFQPFRQINLPAGFEPTSAAAVASDEVGSVHLFYRGNDMQLNHVHMNEDGSIIMSENLGGTLLAAPSAAAPEQGALDVAYVTLLQKVVLRSYRNGAWSSAMLVGIKSEFTPAVGGTADAVTVYVTRLNMQVGAKTRTNGVWGPVQNFNFAAMDRPAVVNGELFARKSTNKPFMVNAGAPNTLIPGPRFTSGLCALGVGEGGVFLLGRNVQSKLVANARFDGSWMQRTVPGSPWISDAPGCSIAYDFCSEIVVRQGNAFYRTEYCN